VSDLWQMMRGDSLLLLRDLPSDSVDALITDPPYSSGGAFRGDRTPPSSAKYVASDSVSGQALPEVLGDSRDQRGLLVWSSIWLAECYRVVRDGGFVAVFSDWRQLSTFGDAVQAGGFITRGILPWIKPSARPQPGRPTQRSEFVIWGSKGGFSFERPCPITPGYWLEHPPPDHWIESPPGPREREHMTEKPLRTMRDLALSCIPGGTILDPFAGAGTTGVGALLEGRKFLGIELSPEYHAIACRRLLETETETLAGADRGSTAIGQGALFAAVVP
jgi:site-specific DNA-methyltransferase (adenine-specific)